jgi:hypothetical protein
MNPCPCGNVAEGSSGLCARCAALQALELRPDASEDEARSAYHLLVKVWHPDRFQCDKKLKDAADEKLKAINSAYRFLTSGESRRQKRWTPPPEPDPVYRASSAQATQTAAQPKAPKAARVKGPGLRSYVATFVGLTILQRAVLGLCGLGAGALFVNYVDSQLASDPTTARVYADYKAEMARDLDGPKRRLWDMVEQGMRGVGLKHDAPVIAAAPIAAPAAAEPAPSETKAALTRPVRAVQKSPLHIMPLITVGLTRDEVLAAAGAPASATEDKLVYGTSEIDFKAGRVSGWKIDAAAPMHVKLWPDGPVDPDLRFFSVGSTKNDVIAVQGTPTLLAQDKFGYGTSEVYFRNNRVVSWKDDPASVPLRASSR